MFPQCFLVLPPGNHCFQHHQEAKFASAPRQKHFVFPRGKETCFSMFPHFATTGNICFLATNARSFPGFPAKEKTIWRHRPKLLVAKLVRKKNWKVVDIWRNRTSHNMLRRKEVLMELYCRRVQQQRPKAVGLWQHRLGNESVRYNSRRLQSQVEGFEGPIHAAGCIRKEKKSCQSRSEVYVSAWKWYKRLNFLNVVVSSTVKAVDSMDMTQVTHLTLTTPKTPNHFQKKEKLQKRWRKRFSSREWWC